MKRTATLAVIFSLGLAHVAHGQAGEKLWEYSTGGAVHSSPAVVGGRLYVGSQDSKLYCLSARDGSKLWEFAAGGGIESSPAVVGGRVYFGSADKKVYCLAAGNGKKLWEFETGGTIHSSPVVVGGRLYIGSEDDRLYCLSARTGEKLWAFRTGANVFCSPAVANGKVYVGSDDRKLYCLNAESGEKLWEFQTAGQVYSSPRVTGGNVYFGGWDKKFYCLDAETGVKRWEFRSSHGLFCSPAVVGSRLYVAGYDKNLYCLDTESGEKLWESTMGGSVRASLAVAGGKVYVCSFDKKLHCFSADDGKELWEFETGSTIYGSSPAVVGGRIYVGSDDRKIYCLDAADPAADGWPMFRGLGNPWWAEAGTKYRYVQQSPEAAELILTVTGYAERDGRWSKLLEWSDGTKEAHCFDLKGIQILRSTRAIVITAEQEENVKKQLEALHSEDFKGREEATEALARSWYRCRRMIEAALKSTRDPEMRTRFRQLRKMAASSFAPLAIQFPLKKGSRWENVYGLSFEVVGRESLKTALGEHEAWKIKVGGETLFWSDQLHLLLAMERDGHRWVLTEVMTR